MTDDRRSAADRYGEVQRLVDGGYTYTEVGRFLGISRNAVAGLICRNRATIPNNRKATRAKPAEGFPSIMEAARWHGVDPKVIAADRRAEAQP